DALRVLVPDGFRGDGDGGAEGVEVLVGGVEGEGCGEGGELRAAGGEGCCGIGREHCLGRRSIRVCLRTLPRVTGDHQIHWHVLQKEGRAGKDWMICRSLRIRGRGLLILVLPLRRTDDRDRRRPEVEV